MAEMSFDEAMKAHGTAPAPKTKGLSFDDAMELHKGKGDHPRSVVAQIKAAFAPKGMKERWDDSWMHSILQNIGEAQAQQTAGEMGDLEALKEGERVAAEKRAKAGPPKSFSAKETVKETVGGFKELIPRS
jgi:hypothetical protein